MPSEAEHREQARFDHAQWYLAQMIRERDELRAENERLRETIAEWQEIHGTFNGDVHTACQTEIERLRAALLKIADDSSHADQYVLWAQEALDGMTAMSRTAEMEPTVPAQARSAE